jgi:hypothetical protein
MKINSIGLDVYRKTMEKPLPDNQSPDKGSPATGIGNVHIPSQTNKIGSKLAVTLKPGTFIDMLTPEEKRAFELVFEKFRQVGSPDGSYGSEGVNKSHIGNFVDVKL